MKRLLLALISCLVVITPPLCAVKIPAVEVPGYVKNRIASLFEAHKMTERLYRGTLVPSVLAKVSHLDKDAENTVSRDEIDALCQQMFDEEVLAPLKKAQKTSARSLSILSHADVAKPLVVGQENNIKVSLLSDDRPSQLQPGRVYQFHSAEQKGAQCGCYVKYNALMIDQIITEKKVLSPQRIKEWVEHYVSHAGTAEWLDETAAFSDLCAALPGKNVYMLQVQQSNHGQDVRVVPAGTTSDEQALSMDDFWRFSKEVNRALVGYFVVNLDNSHYVLVVAIKQPGMTGPAFMYLDSKNFPVEKSPLSAPLLEYFKQQAL